MELLRDYLQTSSQGFGQLSYKFLWWQYGLCQSTQPLVCPALPLVLLESCLLCEEDPAESRQVPCSGCSQGCSCCPGEAWPLGALAMALFGGLVAEWDMAGGAGDSQGTKGLMEHQQDFWMAVHNGEFIWIFCCLKKENRQRSMDDRERISID